MTSQPSLAKQEKESTFCPLTEASLILNSKWDLIVIYNLLSGPKHFSELIETISKPLKGKKLMASTLIRVLRKLEGAEIVERTIDSPPGKSIDIHYDLTLKGKRLEPVLEELKKWGTENLLSK